MEKKEREQREKQVPLIVVLPSENATVQRAKDRLQSVVTMYLVLFENMVLCKYECGMYLFT